MNARVLSSRVIALMVVLVCSLVRIAGAQTGGVITGIVFDDQGGALPGVTVTAQNTESGLTRTAVTGDDGTYRFAALPPGTYVLVAELPGFATLETKAQPLTVGAELRANMTLHLDTLEESITVSGAAPVVEVSKSEVAGVVTQQQIETLPVGTRQTLTLALLMPGTNADESRPRRVSVSVGAGGRVSSSAFLIDGVSNQQSTGGDPRQDFPQGAIREFRINVSQAKAEYGGTTGGVVSIVTKSGTNTFTGEAFEFFRDKALNRMNMFEQQRHDQLGTPKPDFRRHQYGATFGGPVVRDRVHVLVAGDLTETTDFVTVNTGKPQFYSSIEGTASNDQFRRMFFSRTDTQLNAAQSAFVRWGWERDFIQCQSCGGSTAATAGTSVQQRRNSLVAGHTWVVSPRILNEFRFQWAPFAYLNMASNKAIWTDVGNFAPERFEPLTAVYSFPSVTWGSSSTKVQLETWWDFRDDVSFATANHAWKFGVTSVRGPGTEDLTGNRLGTWTFGTDQPFDPANPTSLATLTNPIQFTASFPPVEEPYNSKWFQAYVQDDWRVSSQLTLNLGVRYDLQYGSFNQKLNLAKFAAPIPYIDPPSRGDINNVQPRLGMAWDPAANGRTVLRAAYGLYNRYQWAGVFSAERQNLIQTNIVVRNPTYPDPYDGRDPLTFASTAAPNITIVNDEIRNPIAHISTVGISRELAANMAVNVDAVYTKTLGDNISANINTQDPVTRVRPLSAWGRIIENQSLGESTYKALLVRAEKRFADRYMYLVSYTLARSTDNGNATIADFYNPGIEFGPASTDRRHTLVGSGAVLLPWDLTLGGVWTLRSSMPFSARAGRDLNNDGATTDYVPETTRNQGNRGLDLGFVNAWRAANGLTPIAASQIDSNRYNSLDVRLSKAFALASGHKVEFIGQVFNLFGTNNLLASGGNGAWVDNSLSDSFGRILTAFNRQQGEVAVRYTW